LWELSWPWPWHFVSEVLLRFTEGRGGVIAAAAVGAREKQVSAVRFSPLKSSTNNCTKNHTDKHPGRIHMIGNAKLKAFQWYGFCFF
jgi:hypothetical protein